MQIVIIDNDLATHKLIQSMVAEINPNYQIVACASTAEEGIDVVKSTHPDVVLTETVFPTLSGLDMIYMLRNHDLHAEYIILSHYEEFSLAKRAISLGVREYLLKPIHIQELADALNQIVESPSVNGSSTQLPGAFTSIKMDAQGSKLVIQALDLIHSLYNSGLSLEQTAQILQVTPEYLSTVFHKDVGITFGSYLRNYRIEKAKELLTCTSDKLYHISAKVGYSDPKYFSQVFKRCTGELPTTYRKKHNSTTF